MERTESRVKRIGRRFGAFVVGAGLVLGGLAAVGAPQAAVAAPVGCSSAMYYATSGGLEVARRDPSGTVTVIATGQPTAPPRAVAFNPVDGNLYAFSSNNRVFRVEADGILTDLGVINGLPAAGVNGAAFDDAGVLRLLGGGSNTLLWTLDLATLTATSIPMSGNAASDLAWMDGTLYAFQSGRIARIDPATGSVTVSSSAIPGFGFPSGFALWGMDGHLYTNWGTSSIAEVLGYTTATPTVQVLTGPMVPNQYGGAACESAGNPFLNAEADDFSATTVYAGVGGAAGNVFGNDTLNGATFAPAAATATILNDGGLTGASIAADGTLTLPATATAGTYDVDYRICETAAGRTAVCDTATATVAVQAAPVVDAVDDDFTATAITAGTAGTAGNVFTGDTIDGAPVTPADVTATITDDDGLTGAALTASGDLTVPETATATATAGTYTVTYEICSTEVPTVCDTATAAVLVRALPVVDAVDDDFTATAVVAGTAGSAGNVLTNDTIDGAAIAPADAVATITDDDDLTGAALTASGDLTVPETAAAGTYAVTYEICSTEVLTVCDTATAAVLVRAPQSPPADPGDPDTSGSGSPAPVAASGPTGPLASTGYQSTGLVLAAIAAAAMAIVGAALLARRRRAAND